MEIIKLGKKVKSISKWEDHTYQAIKSLEYHDHYCTKCESVIRATKKDLKSINGQYFFLVCSNCGNLINFFNVQRNVEFYE